MSTWADADSVASPAQQSSSSSSSSNDSADVKAFLIRFYNIYNPEKVLFVDSIYEKYKGSEHILFKQLYDKYASVLNHNGSDEKMLKTLIEKHNRIQLEQNSKKIISDLSSSFAKGLQQWKTAVQTNLQKEFDIIKSPSNSSGSDENSNKAKESSGNDNDATPLGGSPKIDVRTGSMNTTDVNSDNEMINNVYETLNTIQKNSNEKIVTVSCNRARMQGGYGLVTIFCLTKDASSSSGAISPSDNTVTVSEAPDPDASQEQVQSCQMDRCANDEISRRFIADTSYNSVLLQSIEKCNSDIINSVVRDESIVDRLKESLALQRNTNKLLLGSLDKYVKVVDERVHEYLNTHRERTLFEREDILSHLSLLLEGVDETSLVKIRRLDKIYAH